MKVPADTLFSNPIKTLLGLNIIKRKTKEASTETADEEQLKTWNMSAKSLKEP